MEENMEVKEATLESLQKDLMQQIDAGMTPEEAGAIMNTFECVSKALSEQRKAENERARIEADIAKSVRETEAADKRSKRELIGNGVRAGGQLGAAIVAGWVSIVTVARIINAEYHDKLVLSKALGFVLKPRG
jgi:hypothetical protein